MIRNKTRELHKVQLDAGIHNRFDVEVVDAKTKMVKQKAYAENVICSNLWQSLLTSETSCWNRYIALGSGTGVPSSSDVSLFHAEAYVSSSPLRCSDENYVFSVVSRAVITETQYNGKTFTEIGISKAGSANYLCTHAMLKDMNGNPISIVKTDSDIIRFYSTVFVHYRGEYPNGIKMGYTGSSCSSYEYKYGILSWIAYGYNVGSYSYGSSSYPQGVACTSGGCAQDPNASANELPMYSPLSNTYDVANRKVTCTASRIPASTGNNTDRNKVAMVPYVKQTYPICYIPVETLFPGGVQVSGEAIGTADGTTSDFRTYFPIISDVELFINGTAVSGSDVTIDTMTPFITSINTLDLLEFYEVYGDGKRIRPYISGGYRNFESSGRKKIQYFRNPYYSKLGITKISYPGSAPSFYSIAVSVSTDGENWIEIETGKSINLPDQYKNYEWIKLENMYNGTADLPTFTYDRTPEDNANIHFNTPPASGSVITANYKTHTIAKDENHVFDFTFEMHFGEYTPS